MRYRIFILFLICACGQPKATQDTVVDNESTENSISTYRLEIPVKKGELDATNMVQLMESLASMPFEQRTITLQTIKEEAIKFAAIKWPDEWNTSPIKSRYNVFLTHASIASDMRLGENGAAQQAKAIEQMKHSWVIFVRLTTNQDSTVLDTTARKPVRKIQ
ncbi:MAG: hypothetical protein VWZ86_03995 [Flavobacteriaceae bacterium]|jgi:hypothetical protein